MQKPLVKPSPRPLIRYVRPLVTQALEAAGYHVLELRVVCDIPAFDGQWSSFVHLHGHVKHDGVRYDLDGMGMADKVTGRPWWCNARIDIRLHADSNDLAQYQLDAAYLRVSA